MTGAPAVRRLSCRGLFEKSRRLRLKVADVKVARPLNTRGPYRRKGDAGEVGGQAVERDVPAVGADHRVGRGAIAGLAAGSHADE